MKPADTEVMIGAADPLDTRLSDAAGAVPRPGWWRRTRPALGLAPTPVPAFVLLLCGVAVGPDGLAVLSPRVLTVLGPAVSIALAAVGLIIGLAVTVRSRTDVRHLASGWTEALVTVAVVGAALTAASRFSLVGSALPAALVVLLAICAAPSAPPVRRMGMGDEDEPSGAALSDDLLPILLGAAAVLWVVEPSAAAATWLALNVVGIAATSAVAGSLLVAEAASESEQRVFAAGVLLLLGGAAVYLSSPPLVLGTIAGVVWKMGDGASRERIARDLRYVQHPVIVMLLLIAGASSRLSADVFAIALLIAVCRLAGKLAGAALAARTVGRSLATGGGLRLISPGLVGIALALSMSELPGDPGRGGLLLSVVVATVIVSDVMALLIASDEGTA